MRYFLFLFLIWVSAVQAADKVQSHFEGPVKLRVWKHWQDSWNVERDATAPIDFELERGLDDAGKEYVQVVFRKLVEAGLTVKINGRAFVRTGQFETKEAALPQVQAAGRIMFGKYLLFRSGEEGFVDKPGQRIVTEIEFEILRGNERVYHYRLLPMYVRGSGNHFWNNEIDPYSAHGGRGSILVANGSAGELGWDRWNGQLVKPVLSFVDRNTLGSGAVIGLHRHERNQEMWLVEKGKVTISHGVAAKTSAIYRTRRLFTGGGDTKEVDQFDAAGGWIEIRDLVAGEYSVIVPTPGDETTVTCHGLLAVTPSINFTMGTKN